MKRLLIGITTGVVTLLVIFWAVATFVIGGLTKKGFEDYANKNLEGDAAYVAEIIEMDLGSYQKGFLSSTAVSTLSIPADDDKANAQEGAEENGLPLIHTVYNGPLAFTPDGVKACFSYAVTTVDWSKLDEKVAERLKEIFGDTEPVTFSVLASYSGNQIIEIIIPAAEYSDDKGEFRFDGANMRFNVGKDAETMKGNGSVTALSIRTKEDGLNLSMRSEPSQFDFDFVEGQQMKVDCKIGKMGSTGTIKGPGGKEDEFDIKFAEITVKSDQTATPEFPDVLIGSGFFELPSFSLKMEGNFLKLDKFRVDQSSEIKNAKINAKALYKIGSIDSDLPGMEMASEILAGGIELEAGLEGIPFSVMQVFAEIGEASNKARIKALAQNDLTGGNPKFTKEMAEKIINGIEKGTRLFMILSVGEKENQSKVAVDFGYEGAKKMLDMTTTGELVAALIANVDAKLPKAMVDANPMYMMMLGPQIEQGMVKTTADAYTFGAKLSNSKLLLNGQEFPFAQMMGPMLEQEIPWDEFLEGMAEGLSGNME